MAEYGQGYAYADKANAAAPCGTADFPAGTQHGIILGRCAYLTQYGQEIAGAIIMGTSSGVGMIPTAAALLLIRLLMVVKGERYRSPGLQKLVFGSYNRRITDPATDSDWISSNPKTVQAYTADPMCQFTFTLSGFRNLLHVLQFVPCLPGPIRCLRTCRSIW